MDNIHTEEGSTKGANHILFTDLDNTMIYSHRHHPQPDDILWAESLHGRNQSFMTRTAYNFFRTQDWLDVIPLTTRTQEQYTRLFGFFQELGWHDALICNGALLLHGGIEDSAWTKRSFRLSSPDHTAFYNLLMLAEREMGEQSIVSVSPFLFYTKGQDADRAYAFLFQHADLSHLTILRDARKVYCFPRSLDKGRALLRYKERMGYASCMAAGDSLFDAPMLAAADTCFCPPEISGQVHNNSKIVCNGMLSEDIVKFLRKMRSEN